MSNDCYNDGYSYCPSANNNQQVLGLDSNQMVSIWTALNIDKKYKIINRLIMFHRATLFRRLILILSLHASNTPMGTCDGAALGPT